MPEHAHPRASRGISGRWEEVVGRRSEAPELVAMARLRPGDMVLDVASATSEPAIAAAQQVGPQGRVLSVAITSGADDPTRTGIGQRVTQMGFGNVEFVENAGSTLDLPGRDFAAAVSSLGLVLVDDPEGLLRSTRDHVVRGGRIAVSVWSAPDRVPLVDVALEAVGTGEPPEGLFRYADAATLRTAMEDAGLADAKVVSTTILTEFADAGDYADFALESIDPVADLATRANDEAREALRDAVRDVADARCEADGAVRFENEVLLAVAAVA